MAPICTDPNYLVSTIGVAVGVSLATIIFLLSLAYIAAALFKKPEYESYVSIEIYQLFVSALLFVTIFSSSCFASEMAEHFAGADTFSIGRNFLNYMSNTVALKAVLSLETTKMIAQYLGSISFRFGLSVWGMKWVAFPTMPVIERVADFLLMLTMPFVSSLVVQMLILEVIRGIMLPFVLPAGLVLRMFSPTRDAGAFLMATAIGFQIVFPFSYVMHSNLMDKMIVSEFGGNSSFDALLQDDPSLHQFTLAAMFDSSLHDINRLLLKPLAAISFVIFASLFMPALSIVLTIAFIKGMTKFINQKT